MAFRGASLPASSEEGERPRLGLGVGSGSPIAAASSLFRLAKPANCAACNRMVSQSFALRSWSPSSRAARTLTIARALVMDLLDIFVLPSGAACRRAARAGRPGASARRGLEAADEGLDLAFGARLGERGLLLESVGEAVVGERGVHALVDEVALLRLPIIVYVATEASVCGVETPPAPDVDGHTVMGDGLDEAVVGVLKHGFPSCFQLTPVCHSSVTSTPYCSEALSIRSMSCALDPLPETSNSNASLRSRARLRPSR